MKKNNFTLIIILLLVVLALGFYRSALTRLASNGSGHFPSGLSRVGLGIKSFFGTFGAISALQKNNQALAEKITKLEVDRSRIDELEWENSLLLKELGYAADHSTEELVPARIIGREPTSFLDHVIIDRGKKDGLSVHMAVISGGVLIGQVSDVEDNQARVILVTSKDSLIQAMLQGSRSKGILRGGISGLVLENVPQDIDYSPEEYVVTSGLGGDLKEGILIGKAKDIQSPASGIFKDITVEPLADLSKLEMVFVDKK